MKKYTLLLLLLGTFIYSQIKEIVLNESNKPIPYINIWVENENIGTTSNEGGSFNIDAKTDKVLVCSAIGFESLKTKVEAGRNLILQIAVQQFKEVLIQT